MKEMRNRRYKGSLFEERAAEFLRRNGVRILERNYRVRQAEIDIVAETVVPDGKPECGDADTVLLFVEVKARTGRGSGRALEAVTVSKQEKICRCADFYLNRHGIDPCVRKIRFDVVAVDTVPENTVAVDTAAGQEQAARTASCCAAQSPGASCGESVHAGASFRTAVQGAAVPGSGQLSAQGGGIRIVWIQDAFPYRGRTGRRQGPYWRVW